LGTVIVSASVPVDDVRSVGIRAVDPSQVS
jgi:hypothetical protein